MTFSEEDEPLQDDYDSPWKDAVDKYFMELLQFYFPISHAQIDWTIPYVNLDTELRALMRDSESGKRIVDKLMRVTLLTGKQEFVFINIEIQGYTEAEFSKRVFVCHYRIFDFFDGPVASLVVLADKSSAWSPKVFSYDVLGCKMTFEFPSVKLNEYAGREAELLSDPNPFALITLAFLMTRATRGNMIGRYRQKWRLTRILFKRNWSRERILDLYAVLDWMMRLPPHLSKKLWQNIDKFEEKHKMRYVTTAERFMREREREEVKQEGRQEEAALLLLHLLANKFDAIPESVKTRVEQASPETISTWMINVLHANTLAMVFPDDVALKH